MRTSLLALFLILAPAAMAQNWAGILNSSRAIDWSQQAAVNFTIPSGSWTQCVTAACNTVTSAGSSATAAQINAAIASTPGTVGNGQYVLLPAGTYTVNNCIKWEGHSYTVLRGANPRTTILNFTGNCGGWSGNTHVNLRSSQNSIFDCCAAGVSPAVIQPGGSNSLNITGTVEGGAGVYPQGATHITVSGVGSDTPIVGTLLIIDQDNDTTAAAGWLQCDVNSPAPACSANGGSSGRIFSSTHVTRSQTQVVRITNISGSTYTISPGLYASNIRSSQNPGAWWNTNSALCIQCGIENLTFDNRANSTGIVEAINIVSCYDCWLKNIRNLDGGGRNHIYANQNGPVIIRDSYFFFTVGTGNGGGYGIDPVESSDWLVENNIFDEVPAMIVGENYSGWVVAYNFTWNNVPGGVGMNPSYPSHDPGSHMNLFEGNYFNGVSMDTQHGASPTFTYFRNDFPGNQPAPLDPSNSGSTQNMAPFEIQANQHGENIIGNTLGIVKCVGGTYNGRPADKDSQCIGGGTASGTSWAVAYEHSPNVGSSGGACYQAIYLLGYPDNCTNAVPPATFIADVEVHNEMMRWGNYDTVNAAVQWNSAEVPTSSFTFFTPLSVPANHNLPASFYYSSKPAWWNGVGFTAPPFPPIGPDVTGGNLAGLGGHAYEIPARLCYEQTPQDSTNYPATAIIAFDAATCYSTTSTPPPPAPATNMFIRILAKEKDYEASLLADYLFGTHWMPEESRK
jgi:hypothetical protein